MMPIAHASCFAGFKLRLSSRVLVGVVLATLGVGAHAGEECAAQRIVGIARLWSAVRWQHLNLPASDVDWDRSLAEALPAVCAAGNDRELRVAVDRMMLPLRDPFYRVTSAGSRLFVKPVLGLDELVEWMPGDVPIRLKRVEGRYLVVARAAGLMPRSGALEVGDEVLAIDGVPLQVAIDRRLLLIGGSTEAARERDVLRSLLRGATGSVVELSVIGPSGGVRSVKLDRSGSSSHQDEAVLGPSYRRLPGDVGYVDLVNLLPDRVDAMFEALETCRALILDLRGYPKGSVQAVARRLNRIRGAQGPVFSQRLAAASGSGQDRTEVVPVGFDATHPPYAGRIVVLTSIEGQSATEHAVLVLEAAAPITVVGEPTTGTNGEIAVDVLPGGVNVTMTTMDVRHADGTRLQRVGIRPHVVVHQTIDGVRSGRDEPLEAAQQLLSAARQN